jgi:alginate O-acetyltransferase complex protein AlgI
MDAKEFFAGPRVENKPRMIEWLFAGLKCLTGALSIWTAARFALPVRPLLAGWTGMLGVILLLHFGLFELLALAWRNAGIKVTPLMRAPLLSRSPGEFWGERWNTGFHHLAAKFMFRPLRRVLGTSLATMAVFLASGLIHDLVISVPARGGYGLPTLYFLVQGAGILFERTQFARRCGLNRGLRGRAFTIVVTAVPAFWLFHPPFVHNVILPMLHAIGAI